jgi:hypothetical protein
MMDQVIITLKAKEGDRVLVENYRSIYKPWELGTVKRIEARIYRDGSYYVNYDVILDRKNSKGQYMWLYVLDDGIKPVSAPQAEASEG